MFKRLLFDFEKCNGCGICELVCSFEKHKEFNPAKSYIKILRDEPLSFFAPILDVKCDLCNGRPHCVEKCPVGALELTDLQQAALLRKRKKWKLPVPFVPPSYENRKR